MAATAEQPAYNPERTLEEWAEVLCGLQAPTLAALEQVARAVAAARVRGDSTELVMAAHRLADLQGTMLDASRVLAQAGAVQSFEQIQARAREQQARLAAVPDAAPRRARHRSSRKRDPGRPLMRPLPAIILGAVATARHSAAAHLPAAKTLVALAKAHPLAAAASVLTAGGLVTGGVAVAPHAAATFGLGSPYTSAPAPAASIWGATPITVPVAVASAVTRPSQPARSRTLTTLGPSAMPPYLPAVWLPAPASSPDPSQQPAPVAPAAGQLSVTAPDGSQSLDLGAPADGQVVIQGIITLTASGGDVTWGATVRTESGDTVALDSNRGELGSGETATVTVVVTLAAGDLGGSATVRFWSGSGGSKVRVTWAASPPPPADPSPTDAPTITPPATPTAPPTS